MSSCVSVSGKLASLPRLNVLVHLVLVRTELELEQVGGYQPAERPGIAPRIKGCRRTCSWRIAA